MIKWSSIHTNRSCRVEHGRALSGARAVLWPLERLPSKGQRISRGHSILAPTG